MLIRVGNVLALRAGGAPPDEQSGQRPHCTWQAAKIGRDCGFLLGGLFDACANQRMQRARGVAAWEG